MNQSYLKEKKKERKKSGMEIQREFINAVELFLLLSLLFWSFTWNSSEYFEFSRSNLHTDGIQKSAKDVSYARSDVTVLTNQHSVLMEYFSEIGYEPGKNLESTPNAAISIPPFNEWKEKEMTKHEKGSSKDVNSDYYGNNDKGKPRRKLNYASSKCGAKVLASNPEARYRIAVLSEKPDEYMLNPCRAKRWFIVELCDTVEATQFELANYELYSSSPREFSVFWSEIYPTTEWHLLGDFEAKDQRTMQTFDLTTKNLGKFIKVVIYNHHGKEHYCPLSVIRVLGYSMVQKFEDIEISGSGANHDSDESSIIRADKNVEFKKEQRATKAIVSSNGISGSNSSTFSTKICEFLFVHCAHITPGDGLCANEPKCRFLEVVMKPSVTNCREVFCPKATRNISKTHSVTYRERLEYHVNLSNTSLKNLKAVKESGSILETDSQEKPPETSKKCSDCVPHESYVKEESHLNPMKDNSSKNHARGVSARHGEVLEPDEVPPSAVETREKWMQANKDFEGNTTVKDNSSQVGESAVESAGLIHTDSVIFKLTARIKASEKDLNLVNKYLQQLSESYRRQMADMKAMFDQTLKVINIQSEKSKIIDKKQDESLKVLERRTKELSLKIDFLMSSQKDLLKRVVELHGFFLILELIIISTIATIFLNIFHRKRGLMLSDRMKVNYFGTVYK